MQPATFVLDFDSTLITLESLDELARLALADNPRRETILRELQEITNRGMAGTLAFDVSLRQRLKLFAAHHQQVAALIHILSQRISPSALAQTDWFRKHRERIFVISGGFDDYIIPVVTQLGILPTHVYANAFTYATDGTILGCDSTRLLSKPQGKVLQLQQLQLPRPVVVIGDGYTDFEMVQHGQADAFWAFTEIAARPNVVAVATRTVHDFTEVVRLA